MPDHDTHSSLATLLEEGQALRDALLVGDLTEVRFRALILAAHAILLDLPTVNEASGALVRTLGVEGVTPEPGYAEAVFALSDAIDEECRRQGNS
ncbi:MAG TPA: hypothetical protein VGN46_02800 [Luteibacter sp.]|jgi:hypothetical protein|uniref:hypothetical protein n=1 Tax=Luteibacter sp. TaxID=1886636 RepID=UPI002F420838